MAHNRLASFRHGATLGSVVTAGGLIGGGGCESALHRAPPGGIDTPGDGIEVSGAVPSEFQMKAGCRQTRVGQYAPAQSTRWGPGASSVSRLTVLLRVEVEVDWPRRPRRLEASTHVPASLEHSPITLFGHLQSGMLGGHGSGSVSQIHDNPASAHAHTYACKSRLSRNK